MVTGAYERLTWSRGGVELAVSGSVSFSDFRQALTISTTSSGDTGEYTAAVDSESVTFQVQEFSESMSGIPSCVCVPPAVGLFPSTAFMNYVRTIWWACFWQFGWLFRSC